MNNYKNRICDQLLRQELAGAGSVVIEGAKWCGKTTTAEQAAKYARLRRLPARAERTPYRWPARKKRSNSAIPNS